MYLVALHFSKVQRDTETSLGGIIRLKNQKFIRETAVMSGVAKLKVWYICKGRNALANSATVKRLEDRGKWSK